MNLGEFRRLTKYIPDEYEVTIFSSREFEQDETSEVFVSERWKTLVLSEREYDGVTYKKIKEVNKPRNIDKINNDIELVLKELLSVEFDIKDTKGFNSDFYTDTLQKIKDISLDLKDLQSVFMEDRINNIQINEDL